MSAWPRTLQIEPANDCNFDCRMCPGRDGRGGVPDYISMSVFSSLAEEVFSHLQRLVLYGWGEPFMHPEFFPLLQKAGEHLPPSGTILVTTNGSLLTEEVCSRIADDRCVQEIVISCDRLPESAGDGIGHTQVDKTIFDSIDRLAAGGVKVGIEVTVSRENFRTLPGIIERMSDAGVNHVFVGHLYPCFSELKDQVLYSMISAEAMEFLQKISPGGLDLIQFSGQSLLTILDSRIASTDAEVNMLRSLLAEAKREGIDMNLPLFCITKDKMSLLLEVQDIFAVAEQTAGRRDIQLSLPPIFARVDQRQCPYVSGNASVIRADGHVAPCFKYLYSHESFLSGHARLSSAHSFGNLADSSFSEIWNSPTYTKFRENMGDMNARVPWCGDCVFSANNCYFADNDTTDCLDNRPFCSECPYSMGLTRCLL